MVKRNPWTLVKESRIRKLFMDKKRNLWTLVKESRIRKLFMDKKIGNL